MNIKARWKKSPFWLRGGLIAVTFYILLSLFLVPFGSIGGDFFDFSLWQLPMFFIYMILGEFLFLDYL